MSAVGDWFRSLGHALWTGAKDVDDHSTRVLSTWDRIQEDTETLAEDLRDLKKFTFDPKWNTRVILVPRAIEGFQEMFDIIFHGLRDKYFELFQSVLTLKTALSGQQHHLPTNPEGAGIMTSIVDTVGNLSVAWTKFGDAYHEATQLLDMIDDVKQRIETLDDLFLPQDKPRKMVTEPRKKRV